MSASTKALGISGQSLTHEGKTYDLKPMTAEQIILFEAWIEKQMWDAHQRSGRFVPQDEYDRNAAVLRRECGLGTFGYPRQEWFQAATSLPGLKYIMWLTLHEEHKEVTPEVADAMVQGQFEKLLAAFMEANDASDPQTGATTQEA